MSELHSQHEQWKAARARLNAGPTPKVVADPEIKNVIAIVPPTERPAEDVMDIIIAAVGNSLSIAPTEILAGLPSSQVISARKLAMALCVRHSKFGFSRVATYFEVNEDSVKEAVGTLDPILTRWVITSRTPLEQSLSIISREWKECCAESARPSIREIQNAVCDIFKVSRTDLISARRTHPLTEIRQLAVALCKRLTLYSTPQIGRKFGGRDHTTVLHAVKKMAPVIGELDERLTVMNTPHQWASDAHEVMTQIGIGKLEARDGSGRFIPKGPSQHLNG